jgi:hypothetical protein
MSVWNTAFEASPAGADSPASGDDKIRELKSAVRERLAKEHKMDLSTGTASADGWHIQGSAISYYQASAPTTRPDGVTALDANDYGRLWVSSSTGLVYVYLPTTGWTVYYGNTDAAATANKTVLRDANADIAVRDAAVRNIGASGTVTAAEFLGGASSGISMLLYSFLTLRGSTTSGSFVTIVDDSGASTPNARLYLVSASDGANSYVAYVKTSGNVLVAITGFGVTALIQVTGGKIQVKSTSGTCYYTVIGLF